MDRISALRNIKESLASFEDGEQTLPELEREVRDILRTYATAFAESDAYRVSGEDAADGLVVVADSRQAARKRVRELVGDPAAFTVERIEAP
ncbi:MULTISPECIES: hypothetical protein [Salinibaculum]|uniref:DUF7854 family protein n=1 Tax=Salinibaculum TaxID=2732368 RepID=UPI0030D41214